MNKKIRIKDIAELAGDSVGTVDRVLHGRGRVSEEALQKVQETLEQIEYKPNLIARTLGSKKSYQLVAVMPDPALDDYWAQSNAGMEQASLEWNAFEVQVSTLFFNLYDVNSFKQVANEIYNLKPDGVLIAPIFYKETLPFFDFCKKNNISFILFNTNIPEAGPLSFIGQNLYQSGRVAAHLMHLAQPKPATLAVIHSVEDEDNAVHLLQKEKGFIDYFQEKHGHGTQVVSVKLSALSKAEVNARLNALIADKQLQGILVSTSSGTSHVASFLQKQERKDIILIGYDLLKENIRHMQIGTITFLINQNPARQALIGIRYLANHLLLKKVPPARHLFPLEVITQENLNSYLEDRTLQV